MAKANEELFQKIATEGDSEVRIDSHLVPSEKKNEVEDHDESDDESEEEEEEGKHDGNGQTNGKQDSYNEEAVPKKVKLEFVLGDIDDSVYAALGNDSHVEENEPENSS